MLYKTKKIIQKVIGKKYILAGLLLSLLSTSYASIVASIRPLGFIAAAIANGVTDVQILLPDGASPHDYALKPSDLEKIKSSDLFIFVGSDLETFLEKLLVHLPEKKQVILAEDPIVKKYLLKSSDSSISLNNKNTNKHYNKKYSDSMHNMHIWLSLDIARITAKIIHDRLLILYPNYKKELDINLCKFDEKLTQADKNIAKMLQSVGDKRYFVFHDAYGYFEKRYHLASLGYFTINPIIQPGAQRLYQIRRMLAQKKAVCVFTELQFRPAVIETVVRMGILDPLGSLIRLNKDSYVEFLIALSNQFKSCLDKK